MGRSSRHPHPVPQPRPRLVALMLCVAIGLTLAGCALSHPSATSAALSVDHRNPGLLPWPVRGDLTTDGALLETVMCCSDFSDTDREDRAILFAGHVPGGAVVISQVTGHDRHAGQ